MPKESLTLAMLNKYDATPTSNFQPIRLLDPGCWYKFTNLMTNTADPDQLGSSQLIWSYTVCEGGAYQGSAGPGLTLSTLSFWSGLFNHWIWTCYRCKQGFPFKKKTEWQTVWILIITKTYLYKFDPLKPHSYIVKLGFTGVYIIFLISAQKHRLWVLVRTASARRF